MSQNTKQIVVSLVIIVVAFLGFKMFFSDSSSADATLESDAGTTSNFVDGQTILVLLNKLNNVTLDDSVFYNKVFTSLVSFERPIEDQVTGRQNPFLPIGRDGSTGISQGTSTPKAR